MDGIGVCVGWGRDGTAVGACTVGACTVGAAVAGAVTVGMDVAVRVGLAGVPAGLSPPPQPAKASKAAVTITGSRNLVLIIQTSITRQSSTLKARLVNRG